MKPSFCLIIGMLFCGTAFSQKGNISLSVKSDQQILENATVELWRVRDSVLVKVALSDKSGVALFEGVSFDSYRLKVSMVGFTTVTTRSFTLDERNNNIQVEPVILVQGGQLQGVIVSAKKPFVQRLTDRLVVNVENSIVNTGSTAMDVLERSPGIRVGQNDAISMAGKSGVIIMINGKTVPMSGEELGNYLRSLPSSIIERIELITNPPARYDAAGNAGIIDIRMKKDQRVGANGTFTAGYGQGRYPKANTGTTFNYRSKKLNIFGNVNYNFARHFNNLLTRRDFYENDDYKGSYDQDNMIYRRNKSMIARAGADYTISKKTIIGFIATGSNYRTSRFGNNQSDVIDENNIRTSSFLTRADGKENFKNFLVNLNFKHTFDSTGRELSADIDAGGYYRDWASYFSTGYYDAGGRPTQPLYLVRSDQDGFTGIRTFKIDYTNPLKKSAKFDLGIKSSFVEADNDVLFYNRSTGTDVLDSSQSNSFNYEEKINAAYLNFSKEWKKFSVQLGLRAENTSIMTFQVFDKIRMDSSYLELFPSFFFTYKPTDKSSFGFSVSRRIDRPGYGQLNPFRIFVDPSFYASGDPALKPSFTWSYELNYNRKQLNIGLSYSRTINPFTIVLIPSATQQRVTIQTPVNLSSVDYMGINFNAPVRIAKWWNVINNGNIYFSHNKGYIAETVVDKKAMNAQFSTNHSLTIAEGFSGEVNFTFDSGNNTGIMKDKFYWILGAGLQKTILAKKGTLRLNVTDILYRQAPRFTSTFTNYHETLRAIRDTRVANITFTYRFGKNTVAQARRRTTGSEEERRRAGN